MNRQSRSSRARSLAGAFGALSALALAAFGCKGEDVGSTHDPLTAACVETSGSAPAGAWVCGQDQVVECDAHEGAYVDFIYATLAPGTACLTTSLSVSEPGPFVTGSYEIVVSASTNNGPAEALCASTLTVVDTAPPVVTTHDIALWPPNHKYHHVTPADCATVVDACDPGVKLWFTYASSDEPANDIGDGNTADDIANLGCDGVDLRSERQGPSDGRVYTLGWHAEDAAGNGVDGACRVAVTHDQSGAGAIDSGEDHRVDLPPGSCQPSP